MNDNQEKDPFGKYDQLFEKQDVKYHGKQEKNNPNKKFEDIKSAQGSSQSASNSKAKIFFWIVLIIIFITWILPFRIAFNMGFAFPPLLMMVIFGIFIFNMFKNINKR
jgi:Na+/glutamate symporter